ncbi:ATP-dependent DNA helicase [Paenibacillus sp. KN14-4R]|uniref:ATP-dependent DNA helicase n=1 Tax=Paenibacillus sp. KN14-4R TaxID=3445773 RepID=UPI003F9EE881
MVERYPFKHNPSESFIKQVSDFVADVFYDILPEAGFEIRDEQIYMAFQLERAYADKETIFAEAGVGTGKTLVYLLYAICYARYTGKPAIIACADESLIEQLVKPEGDIAKLAQHLNMTIDARLGKSPDQYVCLNKLDEARFSDDEDEEDIYRGIYSELPAFVSSYEALQTFYPYGDRKNYPNLNDELWRKIGWDAFQDCLICEKRHRCGQTLSREHYRRSADLIICSHDFYMEHVWTYEGRRREGQLPLLPDHSSVVFDEGHLLETAAQKALTYKLKHSIFEEIVVRLLQGEVREELAVAIDEAIAQSEHLFGILRDKSKTVEGSDRKEITYTPELLREVKQLRSLIANIEEEIALEAGVFTLDPYQLRIVEEHLEMIGLALRLYDQPDQLISWVVEDNDGLTLIVMPRMVKEVLEERVFAQKMPIVFSSATLSIDGAFNYVADNLGISQYVSFSVESPYAYEEQMKLYAPKFQTDDHFTEKMNSAVKLLKRTEGRALLLFPSKEEMNAFKAQISHYDACSSMRFWFEGDQEISHLISAFQNDEESILCAVTLWEGLDIPGPSLSNVIIWSLPFPPNDPVFMAKRKAADQPFEEVDMPYMLLRLRQGMGRLIRTREDQGIVTILGQELHTDDFVRSKVLEILPSGFKWEESL